MTPFWNDEGFTPSGGISRGDEGTLTEEKIDAIGEKLTRRKSFGRAVVAPVTSQTTKAASGGLSEEQSAQGRVKAHVYWRYVEAASKTGFAFFVLFAILQQAMQIFGTFALKHCEIPLGIWSLIVVCHDAELSGVDHNLGLMFVKEFEASA